jgi:peptidoglycan/xylan/chitin deacetylase (PgdA/CDA1 family)
MKPAAAHTAVPMLLYHSVNDRPEAGQEAFTVTPSAFHEHVRAISEAGRTALSISEFASSLRGERSLPSRAVLVTFDDGFADTRPAVELLLEAGLTSSVFVASGWIGERAMLTPSGVRELAGLIEVGAHSVTHPRLDELDVAKATEEICSSKAALEDLVEAPVRSFAYPHGAYDRRVRAAVVDAGFSAAAAVKNALSHDQDDPYALARVTVMARTTTHEVEMLLAGSGAPQAWRRERLRTRAYRSVRRLRRRLRWVVT